MMTRSFAAILMVMLSAFHTASADDSLLINGAGATFPYPIYSKWFAEYHRRTPSVQLNYQSIGSGGGIRQFMEKTIDFGATDAPMTDEQLSKAGAPVLHVPMVLGAVVVTYNLPGAGAALKLTGEVLAELFLGKITHWDDAKIRALNPGTHLEHNPVLVVHRSDGSGTTAIFSEYLSKTSPEWKENVGTGTALKWPAGLGGKGNEGVTALVKQTPGSVGYVELIYAKNNGLPYASIRNRAGSFIVADGKSVSAAAASLKKLPDDFRVSITDAEGKTSYPIAAFTYLLIWKATPAPKGPALVKFLKWAMSEGQTMAEPLHYAPLPAAITKQVTAAIDALK